MVVTESLVKKQTELRETAKSLRGLAARILATGFGIGYLPLAPGTWASAATVLGLTALYRLPGARFVHLALVAAFFALAWATSGRAARDMGEKDPRAVVIDEILGQSLCLLLVPASIPGFALGLLYFRLFDILKPVPIRWCENLQGGLGILLDDVLAGLYAAGAFWITYHLFF
ncbi:MAG TPA: phosphatidylglycerophosphatase A [Acidobacteriota bacterium]|nr:phosphatidylglycerophosphatase A [Acidobacteriota bacterium]